MLKVFDQNHKPSGTLYKYEDFHIDSDLDTGDKKLSLKVVYGDMPVCEGYLQTKSDEYVVKNVKSRSGTVDAVLNLEALEGTPFQSFSISEKSIQYGIGQALDGTGWSLGECEIPETDLRNAGMIDCDALAVINNLCAVWMCEPEFKTLTKTVNIYKKRGRDRGVYFASGFNLREVEVEYDSYDFYTQIVPQGADDLDITEVNGGKNYLENFQYSTKKKVFVWKDESYTDAAALMEDAEAYLEDLSQPAVSYDCDVIDLAKQSKKYDVLSYGLGDIVTVIDAKTKSRVKQRIVAISEYPGQPQKNKCTLSSRRPRFTDLLDKRKNAESIEVYDVTGGKLGVTTLSKIIAELKASNG